MVAVIRRSINADGTSPLTARHHATPLFPDPTAFTFQIRGLFHSRSEGNASDVGDAEPAGEFVAKVRLVDIAGGE